MVGRFDPRSKAREGSPVEMVVDTRGLHFFDPETSLGSTTAAKGDAMKLPALDPPRTDARRPEPRGAAAATTTRAERRREDGRRRRSPGDLRERRLDRPGAGSFQAVLDGFTEENPDVTVKYNAGRRPDPDRALDGGPGRQPARPRGGRAAGARARLRRAGRAEAARLRGEHDQRQLLRGRSSSRHRRRQALRAALQGGQQVDRLVQRPALRGGGRRAARGLRRLPRGRQDAEGIRHAGLLDRRRGRLDAHGPVREHLPAPGRSREVRPARRRTRSRGPTSR